MKTFASLLCLVACVATTSAKLRTAASENPPASPVEQKQAAANKNKSSPSSITAARKLSFRDNPIIEAGLQRRIEALKKKTKSAGHHRHPDNPEVVDDGQPRPPQTRRWLKKSKSAKDSNQSRDGDRFDSKSGKDGSGSGSTNSTQSSNSNSNSKSGKDGSGNSKSGKDGSGMSDGKSGKDGSSDGSFGAAGECIVTVTNLSYEQSVSDIFVMVHSKDLLEEEDGPLFEFGQSANDDVIELSQNMDTSELIDTYEDHDEVLSVTTEKPGSISKFFNGGSIANFTIDATRQYNRLTLAAGMPFMNDGLISLSGGLIYDGAVYYVDVVDTGVEQNLQLCWSVAAVQSDFPSNTDCADPSLDEDIVDANDNSVLGEGFVHIHRGVHAFEDDEAAFEDLFSPECTQDQRDSDSGYAEYYVGVDGDDEDLICEPFSSSACDFRENASFISFIERNDDEYTGPLFDLARSSGADGIDDFCDAIAASNEFFEDVFVSLEPEIFDFRNPMMRVDITCDN